MRPLNAKLYQKIGPKVWATQLHSPSDVVSLVAQLKLRADGVSFWINSSEGSFTARVDYSLNDKGARWHFSDGDFVVFNEDGAIDRVAASDEFLDEWEQR